MPVLTTMPEKRMIRPMKGDRMNRLSVLLYLAGLRLLFLAPPREPLLLRSIVRAGLFLVLLTLVAVEKQNLLRVAGTHIVSLSRWPRAVKRATGSRHA
jgi:hypothetical protein